MPPPVGVECEAIQRIARLRHKPTPSDNVLIINTMETRKDCAEGNAGLSRKTAAATLDHRQFLRRIANMAVKNANSGRRKLRPEKKMLQLPEGLNLNRTNISIGKLACYNTTIISRTDRNPD